MNITRGRGPIPRAGHLLTASCVVCGGQFMAVVADEHTAARAAVDHRCGTGVVGPTWTLIEAPAAAAVRVGAVA